MHMTYIPLADGDVCYLHLITDAYSRKIAGWELDRDLACVCQYKCLRQSNSESSVNDRLRRFIRAYSSLRSWSAILL